MKMKLSLMAVMMTGLLLTTADPTVFSPQAFANDEEVIPVTLGNIQSFEIENFQGVFPTDRRVADGEIGEYVKTAIMERKVLPYGSPGQAVLHFDCGGVRCNVLKVRLTLGPDGPLLWKSNTLVRWGLYSYERHPKKVALQIVEELEKDYQGSLKVNPEKINIEVE